MIKNILVAVTLLISSLVNSQTVTTSPFFTPSSSDNLTNKTYNKYTLTQPATGSTLTIADGKTLTSSNTLTFTGTDSSSVAFGAGGTVPYTSNNLSVFSSTTSAQLPISDATGTGSYVRANNPTFSGFTNPSTSDITSGAGGTSAANAAFFLNGSSATNYGAVFKFQRNSVSKGAIGHRSGLEGGSSDDMAIISYANNIGLWANETLIETISPAGSSITGTMNATTAVQVNGVSILPSLSGTTGSIGGGALTAGTCASGTVAVTSSTTSMTVAVSPNTYPGDGTVWYGYVSTNGTVTVKVCAILAITPTSSTYNVRVIQ